MLLQKRLEFLLVHDLDLCVGRLHLSGFALLDTDSICDYQREILQVRGKQRRPPAQLAYRPAIGLS